MMNNQTSMINKLPPEILRLIIWKLRPRSIIRVAKVCRWLRAAVLAHIGVDIPTYMQMHFCERCGKHEIAVCKFCVMCWRQSCFICGECDTTLSYRLYHVELDMSVYIGFDHGTVMCSSCGSAPMLISNFVVSKDKVQCSSCALKLHHGLSLQHHIIKNEGKELRHYRMSK